MKTFLVGLWTLVVALGVTFAVAFVGMPAKQTKSVVEKPKLQVDKTRVINVPMVAGGGVQGYIVAQFAYTIDPAEARSLPISPEVFLLDEAFRALYTDDRLDFTHLDKYDVNGLTTKLVAATNKRLGRDVVHDVLIQDFTFIPKEEEAGR